VGRTARGADSERPTLPSVVTADLVNPSGAVHLTRPKCSSAFVPVTGGYPMGPRAG